MAYRQDWAIIKQEYITNPITQEKLAIKYKVSRQAISRHCKLENWESLRNEYVTKSGQDSLDGAIDKSINDRESRIKAIETLIGLKLKAEERILLKSQSLSNLKVLSSIISKSKNNISELTKIAELLRGNATERTEITEQEKQDRINRLNSYRTPTINLTPSTN
ncbi:hypothetical protein LCGC14_1412290 [marine sediment metagenome]|uniref:Uncharacterized protein n=1 Tax=marine sediment metagenome TaxID=412755 RepID=A0A0F9M9C1_9ZZZZ